jgi:hypothetical protein
MWGAFEAAATTWPQCLRRHAPVLETLLFFRPSLLDVIVFVSVMKMMGRQPDNEPWRSCMAIEQDDFRD